MKQRHLDQELMRCLTVPRVYLAMKQECVPEHYRNLSTMSSRRSSSLTDESAITRGMSDADLEDLEEAFKHFDKNGDGSIDSKELGLILRSLGYSPSKKQIQKMMDKVDLDGSGGITFDEFVMMMRLGDLKTDFEVEIKDAFSVFDRNGDGEVDRAELAEIMRGLGNKLSDDEINLLINEADQDKDGHISMKEFIAFMYS